MKIDEFVVVFHSCLDKICMMNMNDELKGPFFLMQANLDGHDQNLIIGSAGGDYSLQ